MGQVTGGTWTYSGNPAGSPLDQARHLVGDVDQDDQLLTDQEVLYALAQRPSPHRAAADLARSLAARFARQATSKGAGKTSLARKTVDNYLQLAERLDSEAATTAVPVTGGAPRGSTWRDPVFAVGMTDSDGVANPRPSTGVQAWWPDT